MTPQLFQIDDYLDPTDFFHFSRKRLHSHWPDRPHYHDFFELLLIEQGETLHQINGELERLTRSAIVFLRPNDVHGFKALEPQGCQIINIMVRSEIMEHLGSRYSSEFAGQFFWSTGSAPIQYNLHEPRFERALNSAAELQAGPNSLVRIEQFLLFIMTRVIDYATEVPDGTPRWLAAACLAALSPEVFRKGSAGFVEAAGRGHEHVCRMTRKHLGLSPTAYINRIRMEHAAMLLGSTEMPIEDIAHDCGIENISHFYKLFRSVYGTTPSQYRSHRQTDPTRSAA